MSDRRDTARVPFLCKVEYGGLVGTSPSRLTNLSETGAFVDDRLVTFDQGAVVRLKFAVPSLQISVGAAVVRAMPNTGMGLQFRDLTPAQEVAIQEVIRSATSSGIVDAKGGDTDPFLFPGQIENGEDFTPLVADEAWIRRWVETVGLPSDPAKCSRCDDTRLVLAPLEEPTPCPDCEAGERIQKATSNITLDCVIIETAHQHLDGCSTCSNTGLRPAGGNSLTWHVRRCDCSVPGAEHSAG